MLKEKSFQANDRGGNGGTFHVPDLIKPKKNVTLQKLYYLGKVINQWLFWFLLCHTRNEIKEKKMTLGEVHGKYSWFFKNKLKNSVSTTIFLNVFVGLLTI